MPAPKNPFKAAIAKGEVQLGCWAALADPYVSEITATAGFDWLLVDAEHAPNDLRSITAHLQVLAGRGSHAIVRPPIGATWMIKQLLDAGAQSLLIPMVESAEHAEKLVRAVRYPPRGNRGVGASLGRASDFGAIPDYLTTAGDEICLLVQVENRAGLAALDDILALEGIDGVFIGPADLAADLGHLGQTLHPEVRVAITDAMARIVAAGKAGGILTKDTAFQAECREIGASFIAVEDDVSLFAKAVRGAAQDARTRLTD